MKPEQPIKQIYDAVIRHATTLTARAIFTIILLLITATLLYVTGPG